MQNSDEMVLQPALVSAVKRLQLVARRLASRYLAGLHRSRRAGPGMEFAQYRAYEPGDDLRQLDWKLLARSDRYYVRQAEVDAQYNVMLVLDASGSMRYAETNTPSKLTYAAYLLATLAYLCDRQGDAIGLAVLRNGGTDVLPARADKRQFGRILLRLATAEAGGRWPEEGASSLVHIQRSLVLVATDLHAHGDEMLRTLQALHARGNEVLLYHILGRQELTLNFGPNVLLEDPETGQTLQVNTAAARAGFARNYAAYLKEQQQQLGRWGVTYQRALLDEPLEKLLPVWLRQYQNRKQPASVQPLPTTVL